jgi:hypothetical protein
MKDPERTLLIVSLVAALVVVPMGAYAKEEASGPPPTPLTDPMSANTPPVEQPLVPEGVFAVQLVEALKMGQTQDEAQAESMLSGMGIEPKNGWIAGYPVTPPVIGEIERGVAGAADAGKLGMGKDQALKAVGDLKARLGLNVATAGVVSQSAPQAAPGGQPASTVIYKYVDNQGVIHFTDRYETIPKEYRDQIEMIRETVRPQTPGESAGESTGIPADSYVPNPEVVNNYYYNEGPPVVTYYAPPDPYYYLYSWVPYPFWCSGFFFRGFFILHDFHRHVFVNSRPFVVSNHVFNAATHKTFIVDPISRGLRGGRVANGVTSPHAFNSPQVQSSARTIVGFSQTRMTPTSVSTAPRMANGAPPISTGRVQGATRPSPGRINGPVSQARNNFTGPQVARTRTFSPPAVRGRSFNSAPARVFSAPPSFSQAQVSSRGSLGGSRGGGSFSGRGGSRSGGSRGGHR